MFEQTYSNTNEGRTTSAIENQTSKLPSLTFLGLAFGAMAASALLVATGRKELGNFVGQWAPTILIMGLYNKIAKELAAPRSTYGGTYGKSAGTYAPTGGTATV